MKQPSELPAEVWLQIAEAVRGIRFGMVQIVIHDSHVVQIERAEKVRVGKQADLTTGGGQRHSSWADRTSGGSRTADGR